MKDKVLNIAEWYDCFNEHPEATFSVPRRYAATGRMVM